MGENGELAPSSGAGGMYNDVVALESSLAVPQNVKHWVTVESSNSTVTLYT